MIENKPKKTIQPTAQPWNRPAWPKTGNKKQATVYQAIGKALTEWERYEVALAVLFECFANPHHHSSRPGLFAAAGRAFGSVRTFEGRVAMLEAAAECYFIDYPVPSLEERLDEVIKNGRRFCSRRNDIAHGVVSWLVPQGEYMLGGLVPGTRMEFCLYPSETSTKDRSVATEHAKYAYTSVEIKKFSAAFSSMADTVWSLYGDVFAANRPLRLMSSIEYHVDGYPEMYHVGLTHDPEGRKETLNQKDKARWLAWHAPSLSDALEIGKHCIRRGMTKAEKDVLSKERPVYLF